MLSKYRQYRKDYVQSTRLREIGNSIQAVAEEVMVISDNPDFHAKIIENRNQELALLDSIDASIPWICKVIPVK